MRPKPDHKAHIYGNYEIYITNWLGIKIWIWINGPMYAASATKFQFKVKMVSNLKKFNKPTIQTKIREVSWSEIQNPFSQRFIPQVRL